MLLWSLNNRLKVILLTVCLVILTAFAVVDIEKEFIPDAAKDEFVVELLFPKGTSLRGNAEITAGVENAALQIQSVVNVVSNIGRVNEFDFLNKEQYSVSKTNLIIKLDSYESYFDVRDKLRKVLKSLSGIDYSFKQVKTAYTQVISPSKYDISVKIKNKDIRKAAEKAELITEELKQRNIDGVQEVVLGMEKGLPGYSIKVNRDKCLAYGLDIGSVANTIVSLVKGNEATYFSDFDKKVAVRVSTSEAQKDELSKILNETVNAGGRTVAIRELIDYKRTETYSEIRREDRTRTVHVYADVADGSMDKVTDELNQIIAGIPKSPEEIISVGGVNQDIHDSFSKLYIALLISVLLMYMILASEFESFLYPFIIIFSVPLGLIGGILLLYLFGESISIISLMGLIILVGIADNDAVVKVEFILRKRKEGMSVRDAVVQAGRDRFRPIVMNSLTVIFGLIPMIISVGAATQLRISLALAVAGGLISATLLTLIIIPVLYTFFEKYSKKY
jgi:HAE1 family hydrophobic/amphiphilic exporter-1